MIRILLQCFVVTVLAVGLFGCSDSKARRNVAPMNTETVEHSSIQYPPDSKAARVVAPPVPRGLGRSDRQILYGLEEYFPHVEESTQVKGRPRRMGQTADNLAYIEIIGSPNDVHSAAIMIGIPNDTPAVLVRNTGICLILLKNALPSWEDGADWFSLALKRITDSPDKTSEEITVGYATVKLILIKQLGICTLSVSHKE